MMKRFAVARTLLLIASGASLLVGTRNLSPARAADIEVEGPTVTCQETVDTTADAPNVEVSVPNPSKIVPDVGKLLREGVGVPAPNAKPPVVEVPEVGAAAPAQSCQSATDAEPNGD